MVGSIRGQRQSGVSLPQQALQLALDALNQERTAAGLSRLEHGIGLHFGEAQYGNIGAPGRLDFTVIGRDVNHASRVEGLCGKLGQRVLATEAVTSRVPERTWQALGQFALKGIDGQHPIAAPAHVTKAASP